MKVVAMIMAGGAGTRLTVLSEKRAKPSVPFAGKYRIIDFTLSNCVNSNIYNIAVLTQYRPHSLNEHIGIGKPWDLDRASGGVRLLQPYQVGGGTQVWYRGTADAVLQNFDYVHEMRAERVLVLGGDHIYKMDYASMLRFHEEKRADLTVAVMEVLLEETDRFGIMSVDDDLRISAFHEKPKERDKGNLASMGIYIFNADVLEERLRAGAEEHPDLDFGKHVIPEMIRDFRSFAYRFEGYWVDVGTIDSYWETSMALLIPARSSSCTTATGRCVPAARSGRRSSWARRRASTTAWWPTAASFAARWSARCSRPGSTSRRARWCASRW